MEKLTISMGHIFKFAMLVITRGYHKFALNSLVNPPFTRHFWVPRLHGSPSPRSPKALWSFLQGENEWRSTFYAGAKDYEFGVASKSCFHDFLVGGLDHFHLFSIYHIWDVIRNPLTNSIIFQDGYCTTKQFWSYFGYPLWKIMMPENSGTMSSGMMVSLVEDLWKIRAFWSGQLGFYKSTLW